jgi:uncharacterized protein (DUF1501 family)
MPFWKDGSLAFVHAESGTPGNKATPDGWLNRLEGLTPSSEEIRSAPTRAVSIGALLPRIFKGRNRVATIASGATAARPTILDRQNVRNAFEAVYSDDPRMGSMFANYIAARTEVVAAIQQADPEMMAAAGPRHRMGTPALITATAT